MWIVACEFGGIIRMNLMQAYENDALTQCIYRELAALFPDTSLTDRGYRDFDEVLLGELPHQVQQ
jgi:hypothetical protein